MTKEVKIGLTEAQRAKIAAATEKSTSQRSVTAGMPVPESTAGRISREALRAIAEEGLGDAKGAEARERDAEVEERELSDEESVREEELRSDERDQEG